MLPPLQAPSVVNPPGKWEVPTNLNVAELVEGTEACDLNLVQGRHFSYSHMLYISGSVAPPTMTPCIWGPVSLFKKKNGCLASSSLSFYKHKHKYGSCSYCTFNCCASSSPSWYDTCRRKPSSRSTLASFQDGSGLGMRLNKHMHSLVPRPSVH